ncbi:MAG: TfoX/Sxy family protein [Pseudomonadota bacterium]
MALTSEYKEQLQDLFAGAGRIEIKRMFGGAGLYVGDACFAIVLGGETLMMRGDEALGPAYEDAGSEQWIYSNEKRGPVAMPYWTLPDSAMDDPDEAADWARRSLVPAQKAAAEKAAAKARKAARKAKATASSAPGNG